jgi:hypothetical protein
MMWCEYFETDNCISMFWIKHSISYRITFDRNRRKWSAEHETLSLRSRVEVIVGQWQLIESAYFW